MFFQSHDDAANQAVKGFQVEIQGHSTFGVGQAWKSVEAKGLPREDSVTATPSRMYQFSPSGTADISGN